MPSFLSLSLREQHGEIQRLTSDGVAIRKPSFREFLRVEREPADGYQESLLESLFGATIRYMKSRIVWMQMNLCRAPYCMSKNAGGSTLCAYHREGRRQGFICRNGRCYMPKEPEDGEYCERCQQANILSQ